MEKIKCLIIDDEPLALNLIEGYVVKTPFLELAGKCSSAFKAMELMASQNIHLVFLDIEMPGLTGMEFSKTLQNGPRIIFTTAYSQYALEGFKVDALDYLVKPFNYTEFLKAANKALTWFSMVTAGKNVDSVSTQSSIMVKSESRLVRIDFNQILYIEGLGDYVKIHLEPPALPVLTQMTMKSLEEKLPTPTFFRVHKSFIVQMDKIQTIERNRIVFGKIYIPISATAKDEFYKLLDDKFIR